MKKLTTFLLFFISFSIFSQILNPVKWEFGSEKISETENSGVFPPKPGKSINPFILNLLKKEVLYQRFFHLSNLTHLN